MAGTSLTAMKRPRLAFTGAAVALLLLLAYILRHPAHEKLRTLRGETADGIPNQVNFVYILPDRQGNLTFEFSHALCVFAVRYYWRPSRIYLHTDASPEALQRARDGRNGKWSRLILGLSEIEINAVAAPDVAENGVGLTYMEHKSDFVRVEVLGSFGGVYLDFDAFALRDIGPLLRAGFNAIGGRQVNGDINSGAFMTKKGSKFISQWHDHMHRVYDGGWSTHSNQLATRFGKRLVAEPGEMLILDRNAMAPGSWYEPDCVAMFEAHDDNGAAADAAWVIDYSDTYLLHAFTPKRQGYKIKGFENITPRYVLERRRNFSRALFPVAKLMLDQGIIHIDDSHLGFT